MTEAVGTTHEATVEPLAMFCFCWTAAVVTAHVDAGEAPNIDWRTVGAVMVQVAAVDPLEALTGD